MKYLFIILALTITFTGYAQKFEGGMFAGLTASQVDGDTWSGFNRAGFNGGVSVTLPFSAKIAGQFEIKYINKGSYKGSRPDAGDYSTYGIKLRYIETPLIIKYLYKPKINFETGLAFGYLLYWELKSNGIEDPWERPFNKYEISWLIGGNYQLYKKLTLDIRYSYSAFPVRANLGQSSSWFKRGMFNNVICFSFYYKLGKEDDK
ncbi:MAG: PorT family protein [Bacteroidetes bacterium]|nr:PorT family protein [Bacteroidota bacterium]